MINNSTENFLTMIEESNAIIENAAKAFLEVWKILKNTADEDLTDELFLFREKYRAWDNDTL